MIHLTPNGPHERKLNGMVLHSSISVIYPMRSSDLPCLQILQRPLQLAGKVLTHRKAAQRTMTTLGSSDSLYQLVSNQSTRGHEFPATRLFISGRSSHR